MNLIRETKFLRPSIVTIISERRIYAPYGLKGGSPGKVGVNILKRADGEIVKLPNRTVFKVKEDDSILIETPGGGGFGTC